MGLGLSFEVSGSAPQSVVFVIVVLLVSALVVVMVVGVGSVAGQWLRGRCGMARASRGAAMPDGQGWQGWRWGWLEAAHPTPAWPKGANGALG